jgi:hypothetical protein
MGMRTLLRLLWPLPTSALLPEFWMRDITRFEGSTAMLLLRGRARCESNFGPEH